MTLVVGCQLILLSLPLVFHSAFPSPLQPVQKETNTVRVEPRSQDNDNEGSEKLESQSAKTPAPPIFYKDASFCRFPQRKQGKFNVPEQECGDKYISCLKTGDGFLMSCPEGLVFNENTGAQVSACDYPERTPACENSGRAPYFGDDPLGTSFCHGREDGDYAEEDESGKPICSSVYGSCSSGVTSQRWCPYGLAFRPDCRFCDYKLTINFCQEFDDHEFIDCVNNFCRVDDDEVLPNGPHADPNSCRSFIRCTDGVGQRNSCDAQFVYSPAVADCVPETDVLIDELCHLSGYSTDNPRGHQN